MRESEGSIGAGADEGRKTKVTPEIAAEAAVWIARLHGPSRSPQMERDFREWQAQSPMHRYAFERCTDTWMAVSGVTLSSYAVAVSAAAASKRRSGWRNPWNQGLAALGSVAVLIGAFLLAPWQAGEAYETRVGEHRVVVLADGTRMSLNTGTRARVAMEPARRTVEVSQGEAFFEVAKDPSRPFTVHAGGADVRATGTAFAVRIKPAGKDATVALDVTLVEGQVVVSQPDATGALAVPLTLTPGERIRFIKPDSPAGSASTLSLAPQKPSIQRDRPRVDRVLAWRRGEAIFDNIALNEAVLEMNRYSSKPIVLAGGADLAGLRVSGLFKTGDSERFAWAVASLYGLALHERATCLELAAK